MMLVLGRRQGESIYIGEEIMLKIIRLDDTLVQIGIDAPQEIVILREEIAPFEVAQKFKKLKR